MVPLDDPLRAAIAFDKSTLTDNLKGELKPKSYFNSPFDQKPLETRHPPGKTAM